MELKDNEYFLYKERISSNLRTPFGWKYAVTSNFIKNNEYQSLGRFVGNLEEVLDFIEIGEPTGSSVTLFSNPVYRGDFTTEGSHGEEYIHQEKGVGEKILKKSVEILKKKNLKADWKINPVSLRDFTREDLD